VSTASCFCHETNFSSRIRTSHLYLIYIHGTFICTFYRNTNKNAIQLVFLKNVNHNLWFTNYVYILLPTLDMLWLIWWYAKKICVKVEINGAEELGIRNFVNEEQCVLPILHEESKKLARNGWETLTWKFVQARLIPKIIHNQKVYYRF